MPDAPVTCRRCRRCFRLPETRPRLAACPYCGASPRPLLHVARSNVLATLLALAGLVVLGFAFAKPFMEVTAIGERRVVSLIEGIVQLFEQGHTLIAVVIFAFSVVFPVLKLLMILAATSRLVPAGDTLRQRLHQVAAFTGKYSLLDVLVLAILIVLVKFEGIATVQVRIGTILFCIAVLLSLAAGLCVNLDRSVHHREHRGTEAPS
jgi:paraquat-inducible protein A